MLIQGLNLSKYFADKELFSNVSLTLYKGEKVALMGPNGSGKTTLLRILAEQDTEYGGRLYTPQPLKTFFLPQVLQAPPGADLRDVLLGEKGKVLAMEEELRQLEGNLHDPRNLKRYGELLSTFEEEGGYRVEQRLKEVCSTFLWGTEALHVPFAGLSGGEKTRVYLAQGFLEEAELFLLDEPTNHLDIPTLRWLEKVLQEAAKTVLFVSHDREFIDQTAQRVLELDRGKLVSYSGNYTDYRQQKEIEWKTQWERYKKEERTIQGLEEAARRKKEWFHKAHEQAGTDDVQRRLAAKLAKTSKAFVRRMEQQMEGSMEKPYEKKKTRFEIQGEGRTGQHILLTKDVTLYRGNRPVIKGLNLQIRRGEGVVLLGPNGSGKSTFLEMMAYGRVEYDGYWYRHPGLKVGYVYQEMENLNLQLSPLAQLQKWGMDKQWSRTCLGALGLPREDVLKPLEQLSPGQRMRTTLAGFVGLDLELLLLDEPTNYLDIEGREALEEALESFSGTVIASSHDRYFLRSVANKVVDFSQPQIRIYTGGYMDYEEEGESMSEEELLRAMRRAEITARLGDVRLSQEEKAVWEEKYREELKKQRGDEHGKGIDHSYSE